jgi:hypothetical protein
VQTLVSGEPAAIRRAYSRCCQVSPVVVGGLAAAWSRVLPAASRVGGRRCCRVSASRRARLAAGSHQRAAHAANRRIYPPIPSCTCRPHRNSREPSTAWVRPDSPPTLLLARRRCRTSAQFSSGARRGNREGQERAIERSSAFVLLSCLSPGNPLLDISAVVPQETLDESVPHQPRYRESRGQTPDALQRGERNRNRHLLTCHTFCLRCIRAGGV